VPIKIFKYQQKEKLGIKRVLEQKRFQYSKTEKLVEEVAICYGINGDEFRVTITDLREYKQCSKCHEGGEIFDYRFLSLKFDTIESAENSYKKMLRMIDVIKKSGGRKK